MSPSHPSLHPALPTSESRSAARPRGGNAADVHYLEEARTALGPIMDASRAVALSGRSQHVRALAGLALAEQTDQLAAISEALSVWGQLDAISTRTPIPESAPAVNDAEQDRDFAEQLSAHAHASLGSARAEMIAGVNRTVRTIAEQTIHAHDRRLAALDILFPPSAAQPSGSASGQLEVEAPQA